MKLYIDLSPKLYYFLFSETFSSATDSQIAHPMIRTEDFLNISQVKKTYIELVAVTTDKIISVRFGTVLSASGVELRHEVVIKIVIASQTNRVNALLQIISCSILISKNLHHL